MVYTIYLSLGLTECVKHLYQFRAIYATMYVSQVTSHFLTKARKSLSDNYFKVERGHTGLDRYILDINPSNNNV